MSKKFLAVVKTKQMSRRSITEKNLIPVPYVFPCIGYTFMEEEKGRTILEHITNSITASPNSRLPHWWWCTSSFIGTAEAILRCRAIHSATQTSFFCLCLLGGNTSNLFPVFGFAYSSNLGNAKSQAQNSPCPSGQARASIKRLCAYLLTWVC